MKFSYFHHQNIRVKSYNIKKDLGFIVYLFIVINFLLFSIFLKNLKGLV